MEADEIFIERVRRGDLGAFDRLYERYETTLFAYLVAILHDRGDAEEIFHDAFLAALKDAPSAFDEGGFRAWLYRVARNLALNRIRSRTRRDRATAEHESLTREASTPSVDRVFEALELEQALEAAVHRLPTSLGELYHLRANGLSYEQIAHVVDVPIGTVKSRMHQMVRALREELSPWIAPK